VDVPIPLATLFDPVPADAATEFATAVASGTADEPVVISTTFVAVVLNLVCAIEISLLARS